MLSRIVMQGHAPQELINLVGYNPVIELDYEHPNEQIVDVVAHIEDYQGLVDKNRMVALESGGWTSRNVNLVLEDDARQQHKTLSPFSLRLWKWRHG